MNGESFFGQQYGNEIRATNRADLLITLSTIDTNVPSRSEVRRSDHRERYCIVKYMEHLAHENLINYPLSLTKGESPDFILTLQETMTIGIEHRDVGTTKFQAALTALARDPQGTRLETDSYDSSNVPFRRSDIESTLRRSGEQSETRGVAGDRWELEWAQLVFDGLKEKTRLLNEPHFRNANRYELILYDNTHIGYIDASRAMEILQNYVSNDQELRSYPRLFQVASVIHSDGISYDVLHT